MTTHDLVVAAVSSGLGLFFFGAAVLDAEWCQRFRVGRMAAARFGRLGGRVACACFGLLLIVLAGMIACHFPEHWPWEAGA